MVAFSDVRDAFDFVSFDPDMAHAAFLDRASGAIYWQSDNADLDDELPDDIDDSSRYIGIPHKNDLGLGKPLALQFAAEHLPSALDHVRGIFSYSGAYARFKDLLAAQGMLDAWHAYEQSCGEVALRRWCDEHEIALED